MRARLFLLTLIFAVSCFLRNAHATDELRIAVASNFLLPLKILTRDFEKQTGATVNISSGSTGKLYAQILHGAPFDIFLAANSREPESLEKEGLTVENSRFTYAIGRLALWGRDQVNSGADLLAVLKAANFKRIVVANPATAPYGAAALAVIEHLGIEDKLKSHLMTAENVSQTYQYVATGNVDLGFVAYSQLRAHSQSISKGVWLVPQELHPVILQQSVLLKRAKEKKVAVAFLDYLKSEPVRQTIQSFGYSVESMQ